MAPLRNARRSSSSLALAARIGKAKEQLLKPNARVSEVAYEVGFQSLTHFNRVFKKLSGESPTAYRAHLPLGHAG